MPGSSTHVTAAEAALQGNFGHPVSDLLPLSGRAAKRITGPVARLAMELVRLRAFSIHATCRCLLTTGWAFSFGSPNDLDFAPIVNADSQLPHL